MQEPSIKRVFELIKNADIIVFTVGSMEVNNVLHKEFYANGVDIGTLIEKGAVGDICSRCLDINGNICDQNQYDKIIGIDFDLLRQSKMPILVACGEEKSKAIIGALNGRLCKVLITDKFTANLIT